MLLQLRNALRGSVRAEVRGEGTERFLNLCAMRGAAFWDVCRTAPDCLTVSVTVPGFFLMGRAARDGACRVRLLRKRGLPFLAARLLRRRALLLTAALCLGAVWWLTGAVWTIGISGCQRVSECEMLALLRGAGLYTGVRRSAVRGAEIRDALLLRDARLGFVTVNLTGCHAQVEVRERDETPPPEDRTPCNIVADRAGVIVRLRVTAGRAAAEVGQTVLPGDLLASGELESRQGVRWTVPARAEADVRTWRTVTALLTGAPRARQYTGRVRVRHWLVLGTRRFPLEIVENEPFACYDKKIERHELRLRRDFRFPVAVVAETEREYLPVSAVPDADALQARLRARLEASLSRELDGGSVTTAAFELSGTAPCRAVLRAECLETTGVPAPLN